MKSILKQTSWLFLAQFLSRIIGFFYTIFFAKNLGVSDFGLYSASLAYFSLVSGVADFGFNRFLIREIARDRQKIPELICNIGIFRLTLGSLIFALFSIGLYLFDPDKLRVSLVLLAVVAVLPQAISLTLDAIFVALQKLQYSSIALLILSLGTTTAGIWLISTGFGVKGAVVALILGQLAYLLMLMLFIRIQGFKVLAKVTTHTIKQAILGSLSYGLLGILGLIYFRIDLLLLTYLRGNFDAGIYGAAYRFLEAIVFIPSALATALFPILAKLHDIDSSKIKSLYFNSIKVMGGFGLLIALGYILILPPTIRLFLPNYAKSLEVVSILVLAIPFMFIHVPGAQVLLSTDRYLKKVIWLSVGILSFNLVLNLIFIPQYGVLAASWITVVSEVLTFMIFFQLLRAKIF